MTQFHQLTLSEQTEINNRDDGYEEFRDDVAECFTQNAKNMPIFRTDLRKRLENKDTNVWNVWLDNIPEQTRQHYNCGTCRRFFERTLTLAIVDENGLLTSPLFPEEVSVPELFKAPVKAINDLLSQSKITGIYQKEAGEIIGEPESFGWSHFYIEQPSSAKCLLKGEAHSYANIAGKFISDNYEVAEEQWKELALLVESGKMRNSSFLAQAEWMIKTHKQITDNININKLWVILSETPIAWINFKSRALFTLLDVKQGDVNERYLSFLKQTDSLTYMRAQKAATEKQIDEAIKHIDKLGLSKSLYRRPALLDELKYIWKPESTTKNIEQSNSDNPLHVLKRGPRQEAKVNIDGIESISLSKFWLHVLPKVKSLQVAWRNCEKINMLAFNTAVHSDAPPILKWDSAEERYPVSLWRWENPQLNSAWFGDANYAKWHNVYGIARSPGEFNKPLDFLAEKNEVVLFIVDDAGWTRPTASALFPSILINELHQVRAVIENFSNENKIEHSPKRGVEACAFSSSDEILIKCVFETGSIVYRLTD